jgi:enterochelin esterase-like enzyme
VFVDPDTSAPPGTQYRTFHSEIIDGAVSYLLYLPPGYGETVAERYPVVYWLHGLNGTQRDGATCFVPHLDSAIRAGVAPAMIAVLVNGLGDSRYYDSFDGQRPVESIIVRDLIRHIDGTYQTLASREGRAVEGFSMGGFGAAHLGFKYPDLFGTVSIMAGALLDDESAAGAPDLVATPALFEKCFGDLDYFHAGSPWVVVRENADRIRGRAPVPASSGPITSVRIVVGDQDSLLARNTRHHELLDELGIAHEFTVLPGIYHDPGAIYAALGTNGLRFYRAAFGPIAH